MPINYTLYQQKCIDTVCAATRIVSRSTNGYYGGYESYFHVTKFNIVNNILLIFSIY